MVATITVPGPFEVLTRPVTLKPRDRQPPVLGPPVRVEAVRLSPAADESSLTNLINGSGLRAIGGFKAHGTNTSDMWLGDWKNNLSIEFDLPEATPVAAIAVWNFNDAWQTPLGLSQADVAVSTDGTTWQTVLRDVKFAEADGTLTYDDPTLLKLDGAKVRKVRLANIVPRSKDGKVGLSEVSFHEAADARACALEPDDNTAGVSLKQAALEWTPVDGATSYRVYLGTTPSALTELGATNVTSWPLPELSPDTDYFWRVDASASQTVSGRPARFQTGGLAARFKLDETEGTQAANASLRGGTGEIMGPAHWAPGQGVDGGALDFDGTTNYVNCGNGPEFDFQGGMTLSLWFKVRDFNRRYQSLVTKGETTWRLHRSGNNNVVSFSLDGPARDADGRPPRLSTRQSVNDGQWHHIVALYDGRRAALFLDGELQTSTQARGPLARNTEPVLIGENSVSRERFFNGWMDDVRLYSYGLSDDEVQALYRAGRPVAKSDP